MKRGDGVYKLSMPLPFIRILIDYSETAGLEDVPIRFPIPEAFFVHKVIVAPQRLTVEKREKGLEQCTVLFPALSDERLRQVMKSQRLGRETWRRISQSCAAINFPLQRLGFE